MLLVPTTTRSAIIQGLAPSSIEPCVVPSSSGVSQCRSYAMGGDNSMHSTTVLCVRKDHEVLMVADGQVTFGSSILKPNVRKTRRLGSQHVIGGFAGATADAFTLFERLESKLEEHPGQLMRAAVELAKMWRMDKYLRRLDASLIVADKDLSLQITGNGDVLEPHDGVLSIGSGSPYALAAARALMDVPGLDASEVAKRAMKIAADSCIYTNSNFTVMRIGKDGHVVEDAAL
jgi:ATP-dependent HslUV protease subunit HslV